MINLELIIDRTENRKMNIATDLVYLRAGNISSLNFELELVTSRLEGNKIIPNSPIAVSRLLAKAFYQSEQLPNSYVSYQGKALNPEDLVGITLGYFQTNNLKTKQDIYSLAKDRGIDLAAFGISGINDADTTKQALKENIVTIPGLDPIQEYV
jgi:hypothetical protein